MIALARSGELPRAKVYAVLFVVLLANAAFGRVALAVAAASSLPSVIVEGLGMSWAFWLASALCVRAAARSEPGPADAADLTASGAVLLAAATPVSEASGLAATGLALWLILRRRCGPGLKAAALILLAITVNVLWGRVLMLFLAGPIAAADAHMVGLITRTAVVDNTVRFPGGGYRLVVLQACTSVQNVSLALVLFVAIVRSVRPAPRRSEAIWLLSLFVGVAAFNVVRLSLMTQGVAAYRLIHGPTGAAVGDALITLMGLGAAALAARRELLE